MLSHPLIWACLQDGHNVDPSGDCEPEDMKLDPPKVLGDLFESVAGAIFIDSGMDLEAVWGVFIKVLEDKIGSYSIAPWRDIMFPSMQRDTRTRFLSHHFSSCLKWSPLCN